MQGILPEVITESNLYSQKAVIPELHRFPVSRHGFKDDIVVADVTKDDLVTLYGSYFAKAGTSSRDIYDSIRISSKGICPLCSFGNVTTLDHYLPKARYPLFSVVPANLIPACADCNKGKGSSVFRVVEDQPLHPYFSQSKFYDDVWIKAEVVHTIPPSITFTAVPPDNWDEPSKTRAINHFNDFDLANRFAIQAGLDVTTAIATVKSLLPSLGLEGIKNLFIGLAVAEKPNSIKGIFYRALAEDDWFCSGAAIS
jgi:5-methylcytosine-specific restriction endonuclease McrA